jgi:hypothetical protein
VAGGETNPLGARAMYLGNTEYRIHGTNQPSTIGSFMSSGCIRLTNEDVEDLYSRVTVGTRVIVPGSRWLAMAFDRPAPPSLVRSSSCRSSGASQAGNGTGGPLSGIAGRPKPTNGLQPLNPISSTGNIAWCVRGLRRSAGD